MADKDHKHKVLRSLHEEVRDMFGYRSALLISTISLLYIRQKNWNEIVDECVRLTRLYIDRKRAPELRNRLASLIPATEDENERTAL